ncbi:hypothetical protein DM02DRAFT_657281 [Periconia macrospinosa]|uniref:Uncharacterized protein n=1 Tax=Periconia macrospinosa TaxID=97972 RepID=A0A2V1DJW9_9PLEO|nr:hypothetical protein DM02DRAFT_657281 [Periconia macrospinosa]
MTLEEVEMGRGSPNDTTGTPKPSTSSRSFQLPPAGPGDLQAGAVETYIRPPPQEVHLAAGISPLNTASRLRPIVAFIQYAYPVFLLVFVLPGFLSLLFAADQWPLTSVAVIDLRTNMMAQLLLPLEMETCRRMYSKNGLKGKHLNAFDFGSELTDCDAVVFFLSTPGTRLSTQPHSLQTTTRLQHQQIWISSASRIRRFANLTAISPLAAHPVVTGSRPSLVFLDFSD